MKIRFTESFQNRLLNQIEYIAQDSPSRARKFQKELLHQINQISSQPFQFRKSIYFDNENIRELIFKGYIVVFQINTNSIDVFGFVKYQNTFED